MQDRSVLYRKMMKSECREPTTAVVYIGAINQDAQMGNTVEGEFNELSTINAPADPDDTVENRYFSWEENWNKLDGSMFFPPELATDSLYNNGIITEEISYGEGRRLHPIVTFVFDTPSMDIRGLTVDFGESFPLSFLVSTNNVVREYFPESGYFVTEDVFDGTDYISIIPREMSKGRTRFRIEKILFGIGITIGGKKLLKVSLKEKTHPISQQLPTIDLSFTVDNQDRYFNAAAPESEFNYLRKGQQVTLFFYQTLADGSVEKVKAAHAALDNTWKDKINTAEFSATDRLYQIDGTYEEGLWHPEGVTAYVLLKDVLDRAGLKETEYFIDEYLKGIIIHNPLPKDTYANCILLIANACRCVMKQNREYQIMIMASFIPDLYTSSDDAIGYASADRLLEKLDVTEYFDWQQDFNMIDGSMFFPPENDEEDYYTGYVSREISDNDGYFANNPIVVMTAEVSFSFFQLTITFGSIYPKTLLIHCIENGVEKESFYVETASERCVISHNFISVNEVRIEITRAGSNQRVFIRNISVEETSDFYVERSDMLKQPSIEKQDELKQIDVIRTVYSRQEETSDIYSDTVTVSAEQDTFKISFTTASIPVEVVTTIPQEPMANVGDGEEERVDYGAEIVRYSNWYAVIKFNSPPEEASTVRMSVTGYKLDVSNPEYTLDVNTTGYTPAALKNTMIDTLELAKDYAEWCADYYKARSEYTFSKVTGDPVLESNDLAYAENEDGSMQLLRMHTVNIKFDGAYSGSSYEGRSIE